VKLTLVSPDGMSRLTRCRKKIIGSKALEARGPRIMSYDIQGLEAHTGGEDVFEALMVQS
jgi:hypothetical protein